MTCRLPIRWESDLFNARLCGRRMADAAGFDEIGVAEIEIAISELGTNIVRHSGAEGALILRQCRDGQLHGLEIEARDSGPGAASGSAAGSATGPAAGSAAGPGSGPSFRPGSGPGFSSRPDAARPLAGAPRSGPGSLGIGLSGVRRLMDTFESGREGGETVIRARKWVRDSDAPPVRCSVFLRPRFGETVSGDDFFIRKLPDVAVFGVVDALGHGPRAGAVARQAIRVIEDHHRLPPAELMALCHAELRGTRGAALALARLDSRSNTLEHVSVGNVSARIIGPRGSRRLHRENGAVGMLIGPLSTERIAFHRGDWIIMHTDGVADDFYLDYPPPDRCPREIGDWILSRHGMRHDDATVMVIQAGDGPGFRRRRSS